MQPNPGKQLEVMVGDTTYQRFPLRTKIICAEDDLIEVVRASAGDFVQKGDLLVISEKVVAITQGRAFQVREIEARPLARFLCRFVYKSPHGIGLGSPETMELALREVGVLRLVFAAVVGALAKLLGIRGLFYRICGDKARAIDGPCDYTIAPYNNYAVLGPENPDQVARELGSALGCAAAVIDANDLGVNILGVSGPEVDRVLLKTLLKDNPLGQSAEQTPLGIIRRVEEAPLAQLP